MAEQITYFCDKIDCYDEIKDYNNMKHKIIIDNMFVLSNDQTKDVLLCDKHMKEFKENYIKHAV